MRPGFTERAAEFLNRLALLQDSPHDVYLEHGRKYVRVVHMSGSSRSVHCFLELETGNVLKAESWKKPVVKNPRSNIFDDDYGMSGVNRYGARYL